jgi:hypothetical protein
MKLFVVTFTLLALAACSTDNSKQSVNRDTLTQRQKDSILANSRIPGARGVGSAMRAADSVSARVGRTDSIARDTTQ